MDKASFLKRTSYFAKLSEGELAEISQFFVESRHAKGQTIFSEGEPSDWLFIVKEGNVKIAKFSVEGKASILQILGPGEVFGEVAVFDRGPYPASALAMTESTILKLSSRDFFRFLNKYPHIAVETVLILAKRLRYATEIIRGLGSERVEKRIAKIIFKLASEKAGTLAGEVVVNIALTRQDIADMAGTTVETAIRVLSRFSKQGAVKTLPGKRLNVNLKKLSLFVEEC